MDIPSELITAVSRGSDQSASPAVRLLIDEILARHGEAAQAILFYGSCPVSYTHLTLPTNIIRC